MSKEGARKGPRGTTKSEVYLRKSLLFLTPSRGLTLLRREASGGSAINWNRGKIQIKGQDIFKESSSGADPELSPLRGMGSSEPFLLPLCPCSSQGPSSCAYLYRAT